MKFNKALIALAALVATASSQAAPYTLGAEENFTLAPGSFSEYAFTLSGLGGDVDAQLLTLVGSTTLTLTLGGTPLAADAVDLLGFGAYKAYSFLSLGAGSYVATITNTGPNVSFGYFKATVTPAIPEPESVALLLAGLGVVGTVMKRRKK